MHSRYESPNTVPKVELRTEPLVREVGPERFWNAHNAVLTHIFNVLNVMDKHCNEFLLRVLERIQATEPNLSPPLKEYLAQYIHHLHETQKHTTEHVELMQQLGYDCTVAEGCRVDKGFAFDAMSNQQLLAFANAYSWMVFCVSRFLLGQSWFLSDTAAKSTVVLRWRWLIEEIHKGLLPALLNELGTPWRIRRWAWWSVNWRGNKLFAILFARLLKQDGCFSFEQLPRTSWMWFRIFMHPFTGFYRMTWRLMRLYCAHAADSMRIDSAATIDEVLMNAQLYLAQTNPQLDNAAFFSGRYFQDKDAATATSVGGSMRHAR